MGRATNYNNRRTWHIGTKEYWYLRKRARKLRDKVAGDTKLLNLLGDLARSAANRRFQSAELPADDDGLFKTVTMVGSDGQTRLGRLNWLPDDLFSLIAAAVWSGPITFCAFPKRHGLPRKWYDRFEADPSHAFNQEDCRGISQLILFCFTCSPFSFAPVFGYFSSFVMAQSDLRPSFLSVKFQSPKAPSRQYKANTDSK